MLYHGLEYGGLVGTWNMSKRTVDPNFGTCPHGHEFLRRMVTRKLCRDPWHNRRPTARV